MLDSGRVHGVKPLESPQLGAPNAKYRPGMLVESVTSAIVRKGEDLGSDQVARLVAKTKVEVLELGAGGKRMCIKALERDVEGWVSVVAQNKELWRELPLEDGVAADRRLDEEDQRKAAAKEAATQRELEMAERRRQEEEDRRKAAAAEAARQRQLEIAERRKQEEEDRRKAAAAEAAKQRELEVAERRRREEEDKRKAAAEEAAKQRELEEKLQGRPTDRFSAGDIWMCASSLCTRSGEDPGGVDSEVLGRIDSGREVEILGIGTGPTGKRVRVRCEKDDLEGWVSVVNAEGKDLLSLVRRKEEPFQGVGYSLGGDRESPADPRAAALAAAERRQKGAFSHGIGEKKAKELSEQGKRDALLKKVTEVYTKRQEEVPMSLASAGLDALQKHLDHLLSSPAAEASPKARTPAPAQAARFEPPARTGAGQPLHPAAVKVLEDMRANPGLDMLQEMVEKRPLTLGFTVEDFLKEHAVAASLEPRLKGEIENLLCRGRDPPSQQPQPPLPESPAQASAPSAASAASPLAPPSAEEQRRLLKEEARTVCGLNAQQLLAVEELEALGFEYRAALEAFLACERNKELAANYLFENPAAAEPEVPAQVPAFVGKVLPPAFPGKPPREEDLSLSMDDMEAIQRIQELGFDRPTSLKAYMACGKDEEAAANKLLH